MVLGDDHADAFGLPEVADYTFTDQELTDILGYMEAHDPLATTNPMTAPAGSFQALQFLPRSHGNAGAPLDLPSTSGGLEPVKSEPIVSDYKGELGSLAGATRTRQTPSAGYTPRGSARSGQNGHKGDLPSGRKQGTKKGAQARSGSGEYRHGHISHSTVEKQRRDRINALIDEDMRTVNLQLRELVPSQGSSDGAPQEGGSADSKRPKHVVLSDTIALVKDLQIKVRDTPPQSCTVSGDNEEVGSQERRDVRVPQVEAPAAPDGINTDLARQSSERESEHSDSPQELGQASTSSSGPEVVVEVGESCLFVKVNCKDRRGLLSDIILALRSMPLEITTAAVTTAANGHVHDVFQVKLDLTSRVTPQDVQDHVLASLSGSDSGSLGDKRRRTGDE